MDQIEAVSTIFAAGVLVWFLYGPWQTFCVDFARDELFRARDAIFKMAARGEIEFDSAAYQNIRTGLNALIRHTHKISWLWLLSLSAAERNLNLKRKDRSSSLSVGLSQLPQGPVEELVRAQVRHARYAVISLLIVRSPILLLVSVLIILAYCIKPEKVKQRAAEASDQIQSEAEIYNKTERMAPA